MRDLIHCLLVLQPLRHPQPGSPSLQTLAPNKHAKPSSPSSAIRLPQPPLRKLLHSSRTDAVLPCHSALTSFISYPPSQLLTPSNILLPPPRTHYSLSDASVAHHLVDDTYISSLAAMGEMTQRYSSTVDPGAETIYTRFNSQWRGCTQVQDRRQIAVTATGAWSTIVKQANTIRDCQHSNSVLEARLFWAGVPIPAFGNVGKGDACRSGHEDWVGC
ncbi:hypothetical protein P692DRAFT_20877087 [Suillus brevipes Sb2]|nr:hypothetical protein P692DRAFT_20877087 [Suillus brevipes Sb2]